MNDYEINDRRTQKEFNGISFSQFKKTEVKTQLKKSILDGSIEIANYWCAELICAGHFLDVWDMIILIMGKHIHYGNPKLSIYIDMRINNFKDIVSNGFVGNEMKMRNNQQIRILFSEIISILCLSQKKHSYDSIKINKSDYDLMQINHKLKADNIDYSKEVFKKDDPKEIFIAFNEFMYCIQKSHLHMTGACYWMEWIAEYESLCKKKKESCSCERRAFVNVETKRQMDIIWMIWDALIFESLKRNKLITKIIKSLLNIFCIHYTNNVKKKRKYIIYYAIALLTENINFNIPIYNDLSILDKVKTNINKIYKQIKANELQPDTNYLFNGMAENNLDKSIAKIETINQVGYIPRV